MIKKTLLILILLCSALSLSAEEGMWLPSLIGKARIKDMQKKGLKLSAKDIYSEKQASLKDAVVWLGGCTGEMISDNGLFVTNHHCGYGSIQSHSSLENDYLTNGFTAMNMQQELPNPGFMVYFLIRTEDVTDKVLKGTENNPKKDSLININKNNIVKSATDGNHYTARVESLYYSNQFFLFVYEKFEDVRLVCAPPSSIGKFGGDTDNWMWPRHTGDFTMFRIYADKDNKPAKYSSDNVPYKPKKFFTISTKGVKENDFTFIYGYPGRTNEYLYSEAVRYIAEKGNLHKIALRTKRLDIMNDFMDKDPKVRIQYSAKNASVSNAWKKWQGEAKGIVRLNTVVNKRELEKKFSQWAADKPQYREILPSFGKLYSEIESYAFANDYFREALNVIEMVNFAGSFGGDIDEVYIKNAKARSDGFFKNYHKPIDILTAKQLLSEYIKNVPEKFWSATLKKNSDRIDEFCDEIFQSPFSEKQSVEDLLSKSYTEIRSIIDNDPVYKLSREFTELNKTTIEPRYKAINDSINTLYHNYMRALMEMTPQKEFYPDANSTLRVAYGKVEGFKPADAIKYNYISTIDGIMEKDNPDIYDYNIPQRLREIYAAKDYGRWEVGGTVPVAFIASNHTTGGNSGSPVINHKGELIGVNFDRCWESTMSDIVYDPNMCRNISVDMRYVLFVIDKVMGAGYLLNEMKIN